MNRRKFYLNWTEYISMWTAEYIPGQYVEDFITNLIAYFNLKIWRYDSFYVSFWLIWNIKYQEAGAIKKSS